MMLWSLLILIIAPKSGDISQKAYVTDSRDRKIELGEL